MRFRVVIVAIALVASVTGCGVTDFAKQAADATACKALDSTIATITSTYQSGIIDSGLITQVDNLIGDQARALLSTGLAEDLKTLSNVLQSTNSASTAQSEIKAITDSISQRCRDAGVSGIGQ